MGINHEETIMRLVLICTTLFFAATAGFAGESVLPLESGWALQSSAQAKEPGETISSAAYQPEGWYPVAVPKTVLAALVDNGVYPDPYYGLNLKSIPGYKDDLWLVMPEDSPFRDPWWYRTVFTCPADYKGKVISLHLDGINYEAEIWLNGVRIAGSDTVRGMFRRFEFPVTDHLRPGESNVLAVRIIPPGLIPDKNYKTKQVEATTGWDDHNPQPPDLNMGVWQPVYLRAQGPVSLRHPYVETALELPSLASAELTVSVYARNNTNAPVSGTLEGRIGELRFQQEVSLEANETREIFFRPESTPALIIDQPRVWWPYPLGPQELYDLELTFSVGGAPSDHAASTFGIRDITTFVNDEDWRVYQVNGQNILIRGGAWMTSDMLLNLTHRRYEALVRYAREAGLNMLRSEGFSIRETKEFYDLCDRYGVMVTQQIFGRSIPDEDLAIACIDDMFLRIRNHPSLAHFLGHDETFPTETLDAAYQDLIARYRVNRTYQPHSGTFNVMTRKSTGGTRTGIRELWTYAGPEHYYQGDRKFDVAWGFAQSGGIGGILAVPDSLRQMMPGEQLWPALETEAWSFHTVTQGAEYFDAVRVAMNEGYGTPKDLEDFCRKGYAMNYNSARGMYEAYGRNKYDASGITTWKYNAAWPAAMTWQYVDWYLRPTAAYHGAKKACQPLHVQYAYDDAAVYVANSYRKPFENLEVKAEVYDFDLQRRYEKEATVNVGPDGIAKAFVVERPEGLSAIHFLKLELRDGGELISDNFYWLSTTPDIPGTNNHDLRGRFFVKPKSRADFTLLNELPPVRLDTSHTVEAAEDEVRVIVEIGNPTDHLAFQVHLALITESGGTEIGPVYWEENFFSLLPGERRSVRAVVPAAEIGDEKLAVRAGGWNIVP